MSETRKTILVTGTHRSGSTWAGEILAIAPNTGYIHEPFNIDIKCGVIANPFEYSFQYVCEENSDKYEAAFRRVIHYTYPLSKNIAKIRNVKNIAKIVRDQGLSLLHKIKNDTPIVKDPIAVFSADWLSTSFDMNVLVMIRHPAAFCSSLRKKNWKFNFNHFLNQPLLMERYLSVFEKDIREFAENEKDIIDQAILLWNCIHHTISIYQQDHPEWLFVRHEDLSTDPISQFKSIYKAFNLEFTSKAESVILESSGGHNPIEQQAGNEFIRNSKENIFNWKKRLSQKEIDNIKEKTHVVSNIFYSEHEW
jgi:hypothetical protein